MNRKILIIRFSSIGDIVLTTPVIRCLKQQLPGCTLHFVTKEVFAPVLENNPYLDKVHTFKKDVAEIYPELKAESFDLMIDLHKNLRSLRLKRHLGVKSRSFDKLNVRKFLAVRFKMIPALPEKHIVDRYLETVKELGVVNDHKGLEYFTGAKDEVDTTQVLFKGQPARYIALVAGGSYHTKKIPLNKLREICTHSAWPLVVLGGKEDAEMGVVLQQEFPQKVINACGKFSISQSASLIRQAEWVITSDTGLMHIASAFRKRIFSVWGNTIPEFGMGPYLPAEGSRLLEVKGLSCRPCSKLGYDKCPRGHFRCMNDQDLSFVKKLE